MILKASERSHARALSRHLLNDRDNEHIWVHEIRGLAGSNLHTAFQEVDAARMGTRCQKPFFHVHLSPPPDAEISIEQFEKAVNDVEEKMGLVGHPRAVVFHEKEGRRHAHAVWSRLYEKEITRTNKVTGEQETHYKLVSKQLSHFKLRLNELSLKLYYENGLTPPQGLVDRQKRDPNNYGMRIWNQAKRIKEDPRDLKTIIRTALEQSSNRGELEKKLKDHGLYLAQGNRRSYLAVHHGGEPMSLTRYSGMKGKEIAEKIGPAHDLPTLGQVQDQIRDQQSKAIKKRLDDLKARQDKERQPLLDEKKAITSNHRAERKEVRAFQKERRNREALERAKRLRKGIMGFWDRVSGRRTRISRQNEREILECRQRDRAERQEIINRQLAERQELQQRMNDLKAAHSAERKKIVRELGHSVVITDKMLTNKFNDQVQGRGQENKKPTLRELFDEAARQGEKEKLSGKAAGRIKQDDHDPHRKKGKGRTRKRKRDLE